MIQDSGNRREFETGAVRDIQEGKGRCDLLPLDVIGEWGTLGTDSCVIERIAKFVETENTNYLQESLNLFSCNASPMGVFATKKLAANMFLEVSKHFEEGAKKYGERNWEKGIPVHCYIDSAVRHYLKWIRGDEDEPHDRAFIWNILCCIWTVKHMKEGENNA